MRLLSSKRRWLFCCLTAAGSWATSALVVGAPPRPAAPPQRPGPMPAVNQGPRTPAVPGTNFTNPTNGTNTNTNTGNQTNGVNNNPNVNNPNAALQGNGPNTNPNAPNNTPNGPNQNPYAPFNGPVGQAGQTDFGPVNSLNSTIPLGMTNSTNNNTLVNDGTGSLGFGGNGFANSFPWFLSGSMGYGFNGAGYGPYGFGFSSGYSGNTFGNPGYYGIGSGGYGLDNLPGGDLYAPDVPPVSAPANPLVASGNRPEVQRQVIEDAKSANSLYYQFREANRAYRARQIARDRASPQVLAKTTLDSVPRWLGRDELDPIGGKIAWPGPFETDEFAKYRTRIETALRARSESSSSKEQENEKQTDTAQIVHDNVREMVELLRTHIEELPADEYMTARKFLDSVEYVVHKSVPK